MHASTHLLLVSSQPTPNLTPALDPAVRPERVILLVSPDMTQRADWLQTVLARRGSRVERWPIDDAWDVEHIQFRVLELLEAERARVDTEADNGDARDNDNDSDNDNDNDNDKDNGPGSGKGIIALNATVDGQTTAHYIAGRLGGAGVRVTSLAQGVPVGGELDYLDEGTLAQALRARRPLD